MVRWRAICRVFFVLLLAGASVTAQAAITSEDLYLGYAEIRCDKSLRIHAERNVYYPLGKTETISVAVPSDVVLYECGYRRARLICAIHTSRIEFRRMTSRGSIYVKCYGNPPLRRGFSSDLGGAPEAAQEAAPADSPSAE